MMGYGLYVMGYMVWVVYYGLYGMNCIYIYIIMDYMVWIIYYGFYGMDYISWIICCGLDVMDYMLWINIVTCYGLSVL